MNLTSSARRASHCLYQAKKQQPSVDHVRKVVIHHQARKLVALANCALPPTHKKTTYSSLLMVSHQSTSSFPPRDNIQQAPEKRRHSILTHALKRVHDEGWTDDAIASGTLDAGLPPSHIGQAISSTSVFGSADLVAFFMDECNNNLRRELALVGSDDNNNDVAAKINKALQLRLSMTLPFVSTNRWHEGMAIGALPQNAYRTAQQLDEMATIVLGYVLGTNNANAAHRAIIVAAYAAAELHLLSDGNNGNVASVSLSGERYKSTWEFLEERSNEAAKLISNGPSLLSVVLFPNPTHVMAASAVASSLAGAALSLAAPTAAAILPRAIEAFGPLQNAIMSRTLGSSPPKGTQPSDYQPIDTNNLPPFDANEKIFPDNSLK
jgi:rpsU-divergently transcribed protein